jgi:hypothetical protein
MDCVLFVIGGELMGSVDVFRILLHKVLLLVRKDEPCGQMQQCLLLTLMR